MKRSSLGVDRAIAWLGPAVVLIKACVLFSAPLRYKGDLLACAQDDFYYYLVVAKNLAAHRGSTFDGQTRTNGYHPLYEALLWMCASLAHTLRGIFSLLAVVDVLSALMIFLAVRALVRRHIDSAWWSNGIAFAMVYLCSFEIYLQMEVTLTLPLCFVFLLLLDEAPETIATGRWLVIGISAAVLMLSRLDSALLVMLCGAGVLLTGAYRRALDGRRIAAFLAGVVPPLAIYLANNYHYFHGWMPVSGAAKQAEAVHGFRWAVISKSVYGQVAVMFLLAAVGFVLLAWLLRRLSPQARVVGGAALAFPFVHWGILFWLSDWKLWGWYGYSLRPAMLVVLLLGMIVVRGWVSARTFELVGLVLTILTVEALLSARYKVDPVMVDIAAAAESMRGFAAEHPGRYAMGDRAGMVGYVLGQPVLQTEGLMMDAAYLEHVRRQEALLPVLQGYGVRYYVGFTQAKLGPCFAAREPAQAGPWSPVMRGELCHAPVWRFETPSGTTMIFDLEHE